MPHIDPDTLAPVASRFLNGARLTPAEHAEVLRMAQGFACKDSAAAANISPDTIRARRKRIYRKLDLAGAGDLISGLLAVSLDMLARREPEAGPSVEAGSAASRVAPAVGSDRNTAVPERLTGSAAQ